MRWVSLTLLLVLVPGLTWGQASLHTEGKGSKPNANPTTTVIDADTNALDVNVTQGGAATPTTASCKTVTVNSQGLAGADVAVDNTAGGVTILAASTTRCGVTVYNSGTAAMRCSPSGQIPTTTVGQLINVGDTYVLGFEGQQAWKCIRTTGVSTAASVSEASP